MYGPLEVCRSNAGDYIGRMWRQNGWSEPGSRESDYVSTREEAENMLKSGDFSRDCVENDFMYSEYPELEQDLGGQSTEKNNSKSEFSPV